MIHFVNSTEEERLHSWCGGTLSQGDGWGVGDGYGNWASISFQDGSGDGYTSNYGDGEGGSIRLMMNKSGMGDGSDYCYGNCLGDGESSESFTIFAY